MNNTVLVVCPKCNGDGCASYPLGPIGALITGFLEGAELKEESSNKCPLCKGVGYIDDGRIDFTFRRL